MHDQGDADFARRFVTAYWQDLVDHAEEIPPGEPVEETLAELLARLSWEVKRDRDWLFRDRLTITMRDDLDHRAPVGSKLDPCRLVRQVKEFGG